MKIGQKSRTILFIVLLIMTAALSFAANLSFNLSTVFLGFVLLSAGLSYMIHWLYEIDYSKYRDFRLSKFGTAKQVGEHIEKLQTHIDKQAKDVKALRQKKEHFEYEAFHDSLTKLPNRKQFIEKLEQCLNQSKKDNKYGFTVLSLDLNRFKTINESLGHSLGDDLIFKVAERISHSIRKRDSAARFGGDEFGIILNDVYKTDDVIAFVELIVRSLAEPFEIGSREVYTGVSVGIAVFNSEYQKAENILRDADIAMYHAKSSERDYVIFDPAMHTRAVTLLEVETDLRHAIERNEFTTFYQPIVNLSSMQLIGFESLIRWNHPTRGLVLPDQFISVSEVTNLIVPITLWILRESCEQLVEWRRRYPEYDNLVISVNLSGKHFAQDDLVRQVKEILEETEMDPAHLKLELTESAVMENAETAIFFLQRLREIGVQISIDDFGTGYSSLSYLHRLPINTLKVDRSFVGTMENTSENGEIVRTIIGLAKTLGLSVIAEGIETVHQLHQLRILDCEYGQGYLFSRPVSAEKAEEFMRENPEWRSFLPGFKEKTQELTKEDLPILDIVEGIGMEI